MYYKHLKSMLLYHTDTCDFSLIFAVHLKKQAYVCESSCRKTQGEHSECQTISWFLFYFKIWLTRFRQHQLCRQYVWHHREPTKVANHGIFKEAGWFLQYTWRNKLMLPKAHVEKYAIKSIFVCFIILWH